MANAQQLDDLSFVTRVDPKGMYDLTCSFDKQCAHAVEIARSCEIAPLKTEPNLAMLTGLGGSAAGGDFVRALFESDGKIPFLVNRDYSLPHYVGPQTLVIACSYSGNTEETLASYYDAKAKGAQIIVVTSGGKLAELAEADGYSLIQIPGGQPPRTALGFLCLPVVIACEKLGLIPAQNYEQLIAHIAKTIEQFRCEIPLASNSTKQLAADFFGKFPIIYGLGSWQGLVANRWKGQICENAKNMTYSHTYPELNHNEVLGWVEADKQGIANYVVATLEDGTESAKLKKRAEVTEQLIGEKAVKFRVTASGATLLEKMLSLALYGDFVSIYLAALNGVDPENIDSINILKAALANVN